MIVILRYCSLDESFYLQNVVPHSDLIVNYRERK